MGDLQGADLNQNNAEQILAVPRCPRVTADGDAELPNGGERKQHYTEPVEMRERAQKEQKETNLWIR
jgi:hypothetical protein